MRSAMNTQEYERREFARVAEAMEAPNAVFVFGSNLAGRHGAGAALDAVKRYGATYGRGTGFQGRSYAVPTKDAALRTLPLDHIANSVRELLSIAAATNPEKVYVVTRVGTGLADYTVRDIAPLFANAPPNCLLPIGWREMASQ
jgi:hypothetical protein